MENHKRRLFICNDIPQKCFDIFQDMRKKCQLCDVTFQVGGESVLAHRIILTAAIPYFRDIVSEKSTLIDEGIGFPNVEPNAFKSIIEFAYTYELEIDKENALNLLSAACHLRIDEVKEACCDFLIENLEPQWVFDIRKTAHELNCPELLNEIDCYVKKNFKEVSNTKEFLKCPFVYLKDIIGAKDLHVDAEEHVLEAVVRWVKEAPEDRINEFPELLTEIRMYQIEPKYLLHVVEREEFIRTSIVCRDLIDEAKHYNLFPELKQSKHFCSFPLEPRQRVLDYLFHETDNENIYKVHRKVEYTVQLFDLLKEKWLTKTTATYYSAADATVELQNKMYYFHWGYSLQYDPTSDSYKYLNYMPTARVNTAAAAFNKKVYVFGGQMGSCGEVNRKASNAVECLHPETNEWTQMKSMSTGRWALSAVTLGQYIYVLGGRDVSSSFNCVDRYDPSADKWRRMTSMLSKRCFFGAAAFNGNIYVCGGKTVSGETVCVIATAEVYSPVNNNWTPISSMKTARSDFTLLSCRSKLYVLGGEDNDGKQVHIFAIYDPEKDAWKTGASTDSRHHTSGAVVMKG